MDKAKKIHKHCVGILLNELKDEVELMQGALMFDETGGATKSFDKIRKIVDRISKEVR